MSGFLNLSDTLAAARTRAARSGDTLRTLLSPSPSSQSSGGPDRTVSFTTLGRQMAGRGSSPAFEREGASGESFSVRSGGGAKDLTVTVLSAEAMTQLCLGAVNGGIKFCMLPCDKCGFTTHGKKVKVYPDHVYILGGKNAAFTNPHIPVASIGGLLDSMLGEYRPREEWLKIFQSILDETVPPSTFETPRKRQFRYYAISETSDIPDEDLVASFGSWDFEAMGSSDLRRFATAIQGLDARLRQFQLAVGEDVDQLTSKLQEVKSVVGAQPSDGTIDIADECTTIWEMFTLLRSLIIDPTQLQLLESKVTSLNNGHQSLSGKLSSMEKNTSDLAELLTLLSSEQENYARALQHLPGTIAPSGVQQELDSIISRLNILEGMGIHGGELSTVKAQLKLIEARLPSDPFTIGGRTFNSKTDVAFFVEKEMPGISFSLFHDVVSLMESITDGHVRKSEVMAEMYQASQVGFDEDEATHVHSFKLIVPSLLGATKEGDKNDPKLPLAAVKDFTVWNPQDNEGGIKKRIQDGMDDVSLAVTESISAACVQFPAAAKLATEMLYQTQVFVNEMCSWVDSFYMELIKTSQVSPPEAWTLVASCLRKFFEVLRKYRAPADRASSKLDATARTTVYLWAMIQVHRELKNIRSHNFRGHPAVAPVITLHVFKTRVTFTAFEKLTDSLKSIDKKITDLQKNFDKLHDRVSKLEKKN